MIRILLLVKEGLRVDLMSRHLSSRLANKFLFQNGSARGVGYLTMVDEMVEFLHRDLLDQVGVFDEQSRTAETGTFRGTFNADR
jgi:hypothetical protein